MTVADSKLNRSLKRERGTITVVHPVIKAVFFDAGGTLFKPDPSVGEIYARVAGKYGIAVDPGGIERLFREEFSRRDKIPQSRAHASEKNEKTWWKNLVQDIFLQATRAAQMGSFDDFFEELYDLFARAEVWKLYPEVTGVLERLTARKLILGIVSNWDSRLHSICEGMRLTSYFHFILASAVVGSAKPDTGIFKEALARSGVSPAEALHVGDSVENDFLGAQRAGIGALIVNRSGRVIEGAPTIPSLEGVIDYLQ